MTEFWVYLLVWLLVGGVNFCLYASDKNRAKKHLYRIPEVTLLTVSFFGGALGGLLAMRICRHKTKHWYFKAINFFGLVWQAGLAWYLFLQGVGLS